MRLARTARWAPTFFVVGLLALVAGAGHSAPPRATSSPTPTWTQEKTIGQLLPAGLAPVLATTLAAEDAAAYGIMPAPDSGAGFRAANPAQRLSAAFRADGVSLVGDDAARGAGVRLRALGYGAALAPVVDAYPILFGARVEYRRGDVTEWYLNSPLGIEQGFTLAAPPAGERTGDLVLALDVAGTTVADDGEGGLLFTLPGGGPMRYGQLTVVDATGRVLPSQLRADGNGIRIAVNDMGAAYPLIVDPLVQTAKLTGSSTQVGFAVAVSGDGATAVIGAVGDNNFVGAAFVFTRSGGVWSQQQKLIGTGMVGQPEFGNAVAVSGDGNTAVIGARYDNTLVGAVFVFTRTGTTWSQQGAKLTGTGTVGQPEFGYAVAVSGDGATAVIGAVGDNNFVGAAFVFTRSGGVWSQQQKLTGSGEVGNAEFGFAVAVSGDGATAVIGARVDNSQVGAAFVFTRSGGVWSQQGSKLTGTGGTGQSRFGYAVALSGDGATAVVGAVGDSNFTGAAFVFTRSGGVWSQQQKLTGSGTVGQAQVGNAVALSGDGNTAVIGAPNDSSQVGAAFVFTRSGGVWSQQQKLTGSGTVGQAQVGFAVAVSGDGTTAVIGAPFDSSQAGAAFVFPTHVAVTALSGTTPQSASIAAPFAIALAVHVTDLAGFAVTGASVTFTAPGFGASGTFSSSPTVTTDTSGTATAPTFTANATAGNYVVTATVTDTGNETTFSLTNMPTGAATIVASTGSNQSATVGAAFATGLRALVQDASGNPVPGVSVTFAPPGSGASGTFAGSSIVTTNSNGVAIALAFTANATAGSYTVSATATGVATPASFALTNTPGPAVSLAVAAFPNPTVAGVTHPFTVTARDTGGNTVPIYLGTVHFTSSDPAATLPANYTFLPADQGVHTFAATLLTVGTGRAITATDTVTPSITGTDGGIAITPAVAAIAPSSGPQAGATPVTITGIGLTGATGVSLGGSACTSIVINGPGTSLTCTTTAHAPGTVDVVVTTPSGTGTLQYAYTYLPATGAPLPPPQPGGNPPPAPGGRPGGSGSGNGGTPAPAPTGR